MAALWLQSNGSQVEPLPPVCMVCGESIGDEVPAPHRLIDMKHWLLWLMLCGRLLPRSLVIDAPLCADHASHWVWKWALMILCLGSAIGAMFGTVLIGTVFESWLARASMFLCFVCTGASRWLYIKMILCCEIREGWIELENVDERFCAKLAALRDFIALDSAKFDLQSAAEVCEPENGI